ncbi:Hypothetical predicted protein [Mytilus galloprovincialis]|uniref:Uncharacterized protein n=1 Tax=Mytilus galloprovincialis TaxID=29158 RepID=A0A8B6DT38_MYTGA|nr:Hypothetical predicted protein [Mytilus galloprovincialis]
MKINVKQGTTASKIYKQSKIYPYTQDIINDLPLTQSEALTSDIVWTVEAVNSAVVERENENDIGVSDKENEGVLSEREISAEVARSVMSDIRRMKVM